MTNETNAVETMEAPATAVAKKATKKATKKAAPKKATKKTVKKGAKKAEKKESTPRREDGLGKNQVKILQVLKANKKGLTRTEIKEKTGIQGGLAKLMGAPTMEGYGTYGETALESRKMVKSETVEGQRGMVYTITEKGLKALAE